MKMRRTLTAASAALIMTVASTPSLAFDCGGNDPATIAANLQALAFELRCDDRVDPNPGNWPAGNPIWEKRREGSCEIHDRLSSKLHVVRVFDDSGDCNVRPRKNCDDRPPENQNNQIEGASGDVANGKYEAAASKLDSLIADVLKSRLNRYFDPDVTSAQMLANELVKEADEAKACIIQLIP